MLGPIIVAVMEKKEKSSIIYSAEGKQEIPSMLEECVDPTGTSDAYVAGFLAGILRECPIAQCGILGAAQTAFVAREIGCQMNLPTWEMLTQYIGANGLSWKREQTEEVVH